MSRADHSVGIDELAFMSELTNAEIARVRGLVATPVEGEDTEKLLAMQERLVEELGRLSARLVVLEEAMEQRIVVPEGTERQGTSCDIDSLVEKGGFHSIEVDARDRRFAWTSGADLRAQLDAAGDRSYRFVQVLFVAIVRPTYAKSVQMTVNGRQLRSKVCSVEGQFCLEAALPRSERGGFIDLEVRLPAAHALSSGGEAAGDWRTGGIAVTKIDLSRHSHLSLPMRMLP